MKKGIFLTLSCLFSVICLAEDGMKNECIRVAVENQLRTYPKSTLQDIYKSFFQDYFGPEHIISDTLSAGAYLNRELASFEKAQGAYYEPTGCEGNFYRVNLSVVKEGLMSRDAYFDAFIRSANSTRTVTLEEWKTEWKQIDSIVYSMNLSLVNYVEEREKLFSLLAEGKYVMHHSKLFSEAYEPHYRIIGKEIFLKEILPNL